MKHAIDHQIPVFESAATNTRGAIHSRAKAVACSRAAEGISPIEQEAGREVTSPAKSHPKLISPYFREGDGLAAVEGRKMNPYESPEHEGCECENRAAWDVLGFLIGMILGALFAVVLITGGYFA